MEKVFVILLFIVFLTILIITQVSKVEMRRSLIACRGEVKMLESDLAFFNQTRLQP